MSLRIRRARGSASALIASLVRRARLSGFREKAGAPKKPLPFVLVRFDGRLQYGGITRRKRERWADASDAKG